MKDKKINSKYNRIYDSADTAESAITRLLDIMNVLRKECPWDREQSHESLKKCLIEESYEVCDAIDKKDVDLLKEELGDVLLQVVFHSLIEEEKKSFMYKDVINGVCEKMIRRHPHIFLNENVKSVDKALEKWENVKRRERDGVTVSDSMRDIPKYLPALTKSFNVQDKARSVGFDWNHVDDALAKVTEEKIELETAIKEGSKSDIEMELGDLLFSIVNVARFLDVDPEQALNGTSHKFIERFSYIEEAAIQRKINIEDMSLEEMDSLWNEIKKTVGNGYSKK